jgi:nucleotide-binding universal stress UspA family protein
VPRPSVRISADGPQPGSADDADMHPMPLTAPGPIVVGVERSDRSRDALALARTLARAVGTRLILVAVYPVHGRSAVMPPAAYASALAEEAEATLEWVARPLAGVPATTRALPSISVTRGLQQVAADESALAIVVGPSHRGALGQLLPGSVGERLLHGAPCPVAVAPRGYWSTCLGRIRRIGLGFVATPEADEALCAAIGIALRTGAEIRALSVVELPAGVTMGAGWDYGKLADVAREDLSESLVRTLGDVTSPVEVSGEVVDGYADDELARMSEDVDLLVCGSRGRGPLGRVMLGSVAAGVLRKARCPVLVVPRGAPDGFATLRAPVPAAA